MSGDNQQQGEKLWEVRELTLGYSSGNRFQHGHTRFIYASSRRDAKKLFKQAGYKQFKNTRLTAVVVKEEASANSPRTVRCVASTNCAKGAASARRYRAKSSTIRK